MRKYGGYRSGSLIYTTASEFGVGHYFYDSARHAINSLCRTLNVATIFTPNFFCKPVDNYLKTFGYHVLNYTIDGFSEYKIPDYFEKALLIIPNFFGKSDIPKLIEYATTKRKWPLEFILIDSSLTIFDYIEMDKSVAHVFSPRKFFPISDGGIIYSPYAELEMGCQLDNRTRKLRMELNKPENILSNEGSDLYNEIEDSFSKFKEIICLDASKAECLKQIDIYQYSNIFKSAFKNFEDLDGLVSHPNYSIGNCVLFSRSNIRNRQLKKSGKGRFVFENAYTIFIPKFWPDVRPMTHFENFLINELVFIPIFWDISNKDISMIDRFIHDNNG